MKVRWVPVLVVLCTGLWSCGYSEQEWQAQLDKYNRLQSENTGTQDRLARTTQELEDAKKRVSDLEQQLQDAGVDISNLKTSLDASGNQLSQLSLTVEQQQKALAEYQGEGPSARADQGALRDAAQEARRAHQARPRGEHPQQPHGHLAARRRALRLRQGDPEEGGQGHPHEGRAGHPGDSSLLSRQYQVSGHTDSQVYRGAFRDNWGLSLMRAREVLLFLVEDKSSSMPAKNWSAAGFGDTDPVADNSGADGRMKNRRCELIVVPSVEEMLDLKAIAK
jgi:chemotaxis protein MotB